MVPPSSASEVGNMVLGEWIRQRRRQKALEEGKAIGLKEGLKQGINQGQGETQAQWEAWNRRRQEADSRREPFDEPPPSLNSHNGTTG